MTVVLLRLVNGNEIMGEIDDDALDFVMIKNPMIVDEVSSETGQGFIVLQNYIPFRAEDTLVRFNKLHVVDYHEVHPYVESFYNLSSQYSDRIEKSRLTDIRKTNEFMIEQMSDEMDSGYEENPFFHKVEKPNIFN